VGVALTLDTPRASYHFSLSCCRWYGPHTPAYEGSNIKRVRTLALNYKTLDARARGLSFMATRAAVDPASNVHYARLRSFGRGVIALPSVADSSILAHAFRSGLLLVPFSPARLLPSSPPSRRGLRHEHEGPPTTGHAPTPLRTHRYLHLLPAFCNSNVVHTTPTPSRTSPPYRRPRKEKGPLTRTPTRRGVDGSSVNATRRRPPTAGVEPGVWFRPPRETAWITLRTAFNHTAGGCRRWAWRRRRTYQRIPRPLPFTCCRYFSQRSSHFRPARRNTGWHGPAHSFQYMNGRPGAVRTSPRRLRTVARAPNHQCSLPWLPLRTRHNKALFGMAATTRTSLITRWRTRHRRAIACATNSFLNRRQQTYYDLQQISTVALSNICWATWTFYYLAAMSTLAPMCVCRLTHWHVERWW